MLSDHLCKVRPCIRRNFPNFLFSRVSELFGCRSFGKNRNFRTREIFAKKFGKKFGNLSLEKGSDINQNCTSNSKNLKKLCKICVFESKNTVFWVKKFGKSLEKVQKQGFTNSWKFWKLFYS